MAFDHEAPALPVRSLTLAADARAVIEADVRARAPAEACGLLLGHDAAHGRHVAHAVPVANSAAAPGSRYAIAPRTLIDVERGAHALGFEVVGAYHSHPSGSTAPSGADRDAAWPWYSYLIAVGRDGALTLGAWELAPDRARFVPQRLEAAP